MADTIPLTELFNSRYCVCLCIMYKTETITGSIPVAEYIGHYRDTSRFIACCKTCGNYGNVWTCPPYSSDPLGDVSRFGTAHIVAVKVIPDDTVRHKPHDAESMAEISMSLLAEVRRDFDSHLLDMERNHSDNLAFVPGSCIICGRGKCARRSGMPCLHPEKVRPSLEACGFDVNRTASELLGIPLKWSEGNVLPEYFLLVGAVFLNRQNEQP